MKLTDFKMLRKKRSSNGRQAILDFGDYHLSIINDGYGSEQGLYEIGVFAATDGVASGLTVLPGITEDGDSVKGHLTEADVDAIIKKMFTITGTEPRQV